MQTLRRFGEEAGLLLDPRLEGHPQEGVPGGSVRSAGLSLCTELGGGFPRACHLRDLPSLLTLTPAVW